MECDGPGITIKVLMGNRKFEVKVREGAVLEDLLKALRLNPVEIVGMRGNEVVPDDEPLREGDIIRLFWTVAGG